MQEIVLLIKRLCIFLLLSQLLLFLQPAKVYDRYFKTLVGLITVVLLLQPLRKTQGLGEEFRRLYENLAISEKSESVLGDYSPKQDDYLAEAETIENRILQKAVKQWQWTEENGEYISIKTDSEGRNVENKVIQIEPIRIP